MIGGLLADQCDLFNITWPNNPKSHNLTRNWSFLFFDIGARIGSSLRKYFQNRKWNFLNRKWNYFLNSTAQNKKIFRNMLIIWSKDSKTSFRNRKWNYFTHFHYNHSKISCKYVRNRKWNFLNWKWDYLSISRRQIKKFFNKMMLIWPKDSKTSLDKKGNGIFKTGNGIISPISAH